MGFPFRGHCWYAVSHCHSTVGEGTVLIKVLTNDIPVTHSIVAERESLCSFPSPNMSSLCEGIHAVLCSMWLFALDHERHSSLGFLSSSASINVLFL